MSLIAPTSIVGAVNRIVKERIESVRKRDTFAEHWLEERRVRAARGRSMAGAASQKSDAVAGMPQGPQDALDRSLEYTSELDPRSHWPTFEAFARRLREGSISRRGILPPYGVCAVVKIA